MASPTFTWVVATQAAPTIEYSTRSIGFGDGYVQSSGEGVNNRPESWAISWTGTKSDCLTMMTFFDSLGGWKSFFWTNPLGQLGLYRCTNPTPSEVGGRTFQLTATFTKAYAA